MNSIARPVRKKATINMIAVPTIIKAGDDSTLSGLQVLLELFGQRVN